MGKNKFLDDTTIVVPSNNTTNNSVINTDVKPVVPPVVPTPEIVNNQPQPQPNITNNKGQEYLNIINQFIQSENSNKPQNPPQNDNSKPPIPIYDYSRDQQTGKVIIESRKNDTNITSDTNTETSDVIINSEKEQIKILLNKTQQDIISITIEIKLHLQMLKDEDDQNKKKNIENKLKSFREILEYNQKRKLILISML